MFSPAVAQVTNAEPAERSRGGATPNDRVSPVRCSETLLAGGDGCARRSAQVELGVVALSTVKTRTIQTSVCDSTVAK